MRESLLDFFTGFACGAATVIAVWATMQGRR